MLNGEQTALENKIQVLTKLGITSMQARIYICLYASGKTQAKTLSSLCRLPRQDVYKTLNELYDIGLVEKALTRPVEFRAIPASRCISLLISRKKKRNKEIEQSARIMFSSSAERSFENKDADFAQILLVPKREPVSLKARDMVNLAQHSICVVSPHQNLFPWVQEDSKEIEKALARQVKIHFITDSNGNKDPPSEFHGIFRNGSTPEIRHVPHPPAVSLGIYDHKKLILELSSTRGFLGSDVIITENPSLVDMANKYFQLLWNQAVSPS